MLKKKKVKKKSNNGKTITSGILQHTCLFTSKKGNHYYHIRLHNVSMIVDGKPKAIKDKDFSDFSGFSMTPNGKLVGFWTSAREAKESAFVTAIKKGIIEAFQTKLNGNQRLQHTQEGDVIVHYEQKILNDGSVLIEASKTGKDLVKPADKNQRRRDSKSNGKKFNLIKNGIETKIVQDSSSVVGKHKKTLKEKNVKKGKLDFPNLSANDVFNFQSRTEIILAEELPKKKLFIKVINLLEKLFKKVKMVKLKMKQLMLKV